MHKLVGWTGYVKLINYNKKNRFTGGGYSASERIFLQDVDFNWRIDTYRSKFIAAILSTTSKIITYRVYRFVFHIYMHALSQHVISIQTAELKSHGVMQCMYSNYRYMVHDECNTCMHIPNWWDSSSWWCLVICYEFSEEGNMYVVVHL